jgi:hypothetical protein
MAGPGGSQVGQVYIRVVPDASGFRRKLDAQLRSQLAGIDQKVKVKAEVDGKLGDFQKKLLKDIRAVSGFVEVKVPVTAQGQALALKVRALAAQLERTVSVDLPVEPELRAAAMARAIAQVAAFRNAVAKDLDDGFKIRLPNFAGLGQGLADIGQKAALGLPSLLSFKGILVALIAVIALLLPPVLALVAGLVTLTPGFLALAVPIGAVALGLDGIKNAAKAVQPEFDALRQKMANTFEKGLPGLTSFTEQFLRLKTSGGLFDTLTAELPKVAQGITSLFEGVVNAVSSGRGLGNIRNIIDNVAEGLNRAAPGVEKFTAGLLQLVSGISDKFPGLGKWFTDLGEKFDKWAERFTTLKDGGGLTGLERLINNVRTGIEGLTSVFQAFWDQGMKDIQNPNFGEGMRSFFNAVKEFVTNTLPLLSEGFKSIATALDALDPLFKLLGLGGNLGQLISDPATAVSEAIARAKKAQQDGKGFWESLQSSLFEVGDPFEGIPDKAKEAGSKSKVEFDKGFNGGVPGQPGNLPPLVNQDTSWWDQLKLKFTTGIEALKISFNGLWTSIKTSASTAFTTLGVTATTWFTNFKTTLMSLPLVIGTALGSLAGTIFNTVVLTLSNLPQYISTAFATIPLIVGNALSGLASTVRAKGGEAVNEVGSWPGRFVAALGSLAGTLSAAGTELVQGLITSITTKVVEVTVELSSWPEKFKSAVGDLSETLVDAGVQLVAGFLSGFISKAADALAQVGEWASRLGGAARDALGINSPSRVFMAIGEGVGEGLIKGIDNQSGSTIETVRALMLAMRDVFGTAEGVNFNFNFGGGMPSGLSTQMASVASSAQTFQTSMDSAATSLAPIASGDIKDQIDALTQQLLDLEIQRKTLMQQKYSGADNGALKAQLDQIAAQKNALGLQKDQLNYQLKYGGAVNQTTQGYQDQIKSLQKMPLDFAMATGNQFLSDLGWSGQGAIPSLMQQGVDFGSQFVFNVANMDDALSGQKVLQNRQMQATIGR